jgi:hypothetical protein
VNLVLRAVAPALFIALCDEGPPTMDWLGAPDQGARTIPVTAFGP